jgi:hypothetical protein
MHPATRTFNEVLIRAVKMILRAWETWLRDRSA